MPKAYISVGSNLGNRMKNIEKALTFMSGSEKIVLVKRSSIYETDPVGGPKQGKYLNGVVEIETTLSPHDLLSELNGIEKKLDRVRAEINGPRTIDLDILTYDDVAVKDKDLVIPHPRMREREFVQRGLREIAETGG